MQINSAHAGLRSGGSTGIALRGWRRAGCLGWLVLVGLGLSPAFSQTEPVVNAGSELDVAVSSAGLITLRCPGRPIAEALELISRQAQANIVTTKSVTGEVSANLYDVTLTEALDAILLPNGLAHRRIKNVIYVGTPEEMAENGPPPELRVYRLHYIDRAQAVAAVAGLLGPRGRIADAGAPDGAPVAGIGGGRSGPTTAAFGDAAVDYVVVIDAPDRLALIEELLEDIDERPRQVLIEATILRATLSEQNRLGVDLTLLSGVDFQNVDSVSNAAADLTLGRLPPDQFQETTMNLSSNLIGNFPDGGFTFGIIKNNVAAFIRALEDVTDVTVLAHPKVVALNKQPAEVIVGRRDGYLTTTVTETAAIQTVEFLETGTQIQLVPLINPDGTVRLDVRPKDSNGGLNASNLPFEETTEAHAQLLIEDGHTVLIGGLFRERTVSSTSQIPVLGDVPLAGALFRRQNEETVREEVIILLTVRVMDDPAAEQADVIDMLEDIERIRVGSRRGLMGTGRERLAQGFYQQALKDWEAGYPDRALFNVRMALHNHSRHLAAFKLKEELLQERLWASDGARIREFLFELLAEAPDADKLSPDYGRPAVHEKLIRGEPLPGPAVEDAE